MWNTGILQATCLHLVFLNTEFLGVAGDSVFGNTTCRGISLVSFCLCFPLAHALPLCCLSCLWISKLTLLCPFGLFLNPNTWMVVQSHFYRSCGDYGKCILRATERLCSDCARSSKSSWGKEVKDELNVLAKNPWNPGTGFFFHYLHFPKYFQQWHFLKLFF